MLVSIRKALVIVLGLGLCFFVCCSKRNDGGGSSSEEEAVVLNGPFDRAYDFSCGVGLVDIGDSGTRGARVRQYFIDSAGRVVLEPVFEANFEVSSFSEGLAAISIGFRDTA